MRLAAITCAFLALAACEPSPELDGAPSAPASSPAPDDAGLAPGDLAGGPPPGALLPGVINLVPPAGMQVIENCETIIAPDYTTPPKMVCLLFSVHDNAGGQLAPDFTSAMATAGWTFIRAQGAENYFERPTPGGDCADIAAVSIVADTQKLVDHATPNDGPPLALPTHTIWQAYSIPVSILEACGADRMKPQADR